MQWVAVMWLADETFALTSSWTGVSGECVFSERDFHKNSDIVIERYVFVCKAGPIPSLSTSLKPLSVNLYDVILAMFTEQVCENEASLSVHSHICFQSWAQDWHAHRSWLINTSFNRNTMTWWEKNGPLSFLHVFGSTQLLLMWLVSV